MEQKLKNIYILDNNIDIKEQIKRDEQKLCMFTKYDTYGFPYFSCNNKVEPWEYSFNQYNKLWIVFGMLCDKCINYLSC